MIMFYLIYFHFLATASTLNVILMRNSELSSGIEVADKDGKIVGSSQIAAKEVNRAHSNYTTSYNARSCFKMPCSDRWMLQLWLL